MGLFDILGAFAADNQLSNAQDTIEGLTEFKPQGFQGPGGFGITAGGQGTLGPEQQALMNQLIQSSQGQLQGGLFNDPNFQRAFQNNDIFGAMQNQNQQLGVQAGNTAFGQNQNLFNQAQGLSGMFAQQAQQGPQDLSGGLMGNLFSQGAANQFAAGDQSALFNQSLQAQRGAVESQNTSFFNKLQDRQFAQGRLGSTGGAEQSQAFFNSLNQQDLGFQNNAFGQAQQRSNFLANLGGQQIGQGQGFLSQSLGQFNQGTQFANLFGQQASGIEGQQFGQSMQALQQNQSAGQQRLSNALGLFGQGTSTFNEAFGQGLQGQAQLTNINDLFSNLFLGQQNAAANRIGATGLHAGSIASLGQSRASNIGDVISGFGESFNPFGGP